MKTHAIMLTMLVQMHVSLTRCYLNVNFVGKFLKVMNFKTNKQLRYDQH